ncbi:MAG: penicillin-binding protein activator LpoB [Bdellovibrionaceae bacterium]|nr:penicillin-binding protein activator LpoB [Pseudobdellovibrionaceae bacterium]
MKMQFIVLAILLGIFAQGCSSRQFSHGSYDDVDNENLLNDRWSETDMQKAVNELVTGLVSYRGIGEAKRPPIVMVTKLQNKTSEVIDTQNIMDMVKVDLTASGKVKFIDKEARQDIADEYEYQNSGMVSNSSKKGPGGQTGADYIINGRLDSIVQEVGKDKTVYYKLTLMLTNLKTSEIDWAGQKQIRKVFKKRRVGI